MPRDDFQRIYSGCLDLPVMKAITGFVREQKDWAPDWAGSVRDQNHLLEHELHFDFLSDFGEIVDRLRNEYDAVLGPRIHLVGPRDVDLAKGVVLAFDFDEGLDEDVLRLSEGFEWSDSAFSRAALFYKRECGWDFPPGEVGIWLAYCILTSSVGGGDHFTYSGNLVGFAVLYDRDEDGEYESLAHLWTARGARRKGVGRQLMERARRDFPIRVIEPPWTAAGRALTEAVWPEKVRERDRLLGRLGEG